VSIRTPDQRLRVFVSSTLGELAEERRAVERAISALRLTPVMFELGARPHPPQDVYRAYLEQSDIFVGLYWQQYGWVGPDMQVSGLEEEFGLSQSLPRLLYVKSPAPDREPRLADLLSRIKGDSLVSYRYFRTPGELGRLVRDDLATLLSERFADRSQAEPVAHPRGPRPLPVSATSLIGRYQAVSEVAGMFGQRGLRLVTLTGPGGVGKTRLALAVGERLRDRFGEGIAFVPLAAVTDPRLVLTTIGRAVGADVGGTGSPLQALAERFGGDAWLIVLDDVDQLTKAAPDLGELLACCPGVVILATSRRVLELQAEREFPVPPLPTPSSSLSVSAPEVTDSPAVALFAERARAVRPDFTVNAENASAAAEICRRLEGLPLAIELAAARIRLLDPQSLLDRLSRSLDALGAGSVDLPERQQTLRATVEWSVGLLDDAERSLLEVTTVFVDGWTVEAAAEVAGLEENRVLGLSEALARNSLIYVDSTRFGPRSRMLETICQYVSEARAARPDADQIRRRHAGYYWSLAQQANRPLREAGQNEWLGRLQAEAGNVASAIAWYVDHDPAPLPDLFWALLPLIVLQDDLAHLRDWVERLLPTAGSLAPQAQAELLLTAAVASREVGDDEAALAIRQRMPALLKTIEDPFLHAVSLLGMGWITSITGDADGGLEEASAALEKLRGQDEPFWTTVALVSVGSVETALGRYDDALRHLTEMRDRAEQLGSARLIAASKVQLGTLAVMLGHAEEARALLDEALDLNVELNVIRNVILCLALFAQLAFDVADPERAALLIGAAEGLRQRAGLRAWPSPQKGGTSLADQVRQALGTGRFEQVFAAGTRLSQREAVASARASPTPAPELPTA
jgi:predicted ATPase